MIVELLEFFLPVSGIHWEGWVGLGSNQGVSCRNIGQEQLRVKQWARMTIKNSLFGFNSNGLLNHGKEGKTRYYVIQCRFSEFLIQLCIKKRFSLGPSRYITTVRFFLGPVQKYYWPGTRGCWSLVQDHFWGMWRNNYFSGKYSPLNPKYPEVPLCTQKYLNVLRIISKYAKKTLKGRFLYISAIDGQN